MIHLMEKEELYDNEEYNDDVFPIAFNICEC